MIESIRDMGPSAIDQLSALLNLSDEKLNEYANLYAEKQELANSLAVEELATLREDTDRQIQENMDSLSTIFESVVDESKSWGSDLMQNFIAGIEEMKPQLYDTAFDFSKRLRESIGVPYQVGNAFDFGSDISVSNRNGITSVPNTATNTMQNVNQTMTVDFVLRMDDGTVLQTLSRRLYPFMQNESVIHGSSMVKGGAFV